MSGSYDGKISIWDVETGTVKKSIEVDAKINSFEVLQSGDLVSASDAQEICQIC